MNEDRGHVASEHLYVRNTPHCHASLASTPLLVAAADLKARFARYRGVGTQALQVLLACVHISGKGLDTHTVRGTAP